MNGPRPRRGGGMQPPKSMKGQWKTLGRVMSVVFEHYRIPFFIVIACILATSVCTIQGTLFTQTLIDDFITPMLSGTISA